MRVHLEEHRPCLPARLGEQGVDRGDVDELHALAREHSGELAVRELVRLEQRVAAVAAGEDQVDVAGSLPAAMWRTSHDGSPAASRASCAKFVDDGSRERIRPW